MGIRPEKIGDFLEAAYDLDANDQEWLAAMSERVRAVFGRAGPTQSVIYDASDINAFRVECLRFAMMDEREIDAVMRGLRWFTPAFVVRTFRSTLVGGEREAGPEMAPFYEGMRRFGLMDAFNINGLDPRGAGVLLRLWLRQSVKLAPAELAILRRLAHHLASAFRCRRRLQAVGTATDVTDGAEAILDARLRVVHAAGPAQSTAARSELVETAKARDRVRVDRRQPVEHLGRWPALSWARWTLVDSFEESGRRYIVARENQTHVHGLAALSDRERQAVAYLAVGLTTKETAYALGIAAVTVRVLLARATDKLGVRSRAALLDHPEVRRLVPDASPVDGASPARRTT